jgi:hypothetical protein
MTSEEIKNHPADQIHEVVFLREIAYQLAVMNENNKEKFNFWLGLLDKIADKINAIGKETR